MREFDVFIRDNTTITIIHKVKNLDTKYLNSIVSSRMPFGLSSSVKPRKQGDIKLISSSGIGNISSNLITKGNHLIPKWKVLLSKASNDHGGQPDKYGTRRIFSRVEIMPPNTVCTESYLIAGSFDSEYQALNMVAYLKTKFVRFLVSSVLLTQNITKSKFMFVPMQDFSESWTDEKLYKKYGLTEDEIAFIESMIRPMEV